MVSYENNPPISTENLVCIYHDNCFDGFTAAYVVEQLVDESVTFLPGQYGEPCPEFEEGKNVLMIDVSYPRGEMLEIAERANEFLVLDHHKTAEEELEGLDFAVFDMDRSGAGLAWDVMTNGAPRPRLVSHVEDRDLWRFDIPGTKAVHAYLSSLSWDFTNWKRAEDMLAEDPDQLFEIGEHIRRFQERRYEDVAELFFMGRLKTRGDGMTYVINMPMANVGITNFKSGGIHTFLRNTKHSIAGAYACGPDGKYYWSLRSEEPYDCSDIAREFGGGGHPQASGFRTEHPPQYVGPIEL
jgi:oligoribonuclease NrnB/cAMP/cGMP phosphodiesterase (DHH superfamily)